MLATFFKQIYIHKDTRGTYRLIPYDFAG